MAVGLSDCEAFKQAQENHCVCKQKDEADKILTKWMKSFYAKNDPDSVRLVPRRVKKLKTAEKRALYIHNRMLKTHPGDIIRKKTEHDEL